MWQEKLRCETCSGEVIDLKVLNCKHKLCRECCAQNFQCSTGDDVVCPIDRKITKLQNIDLPVQIDALNVHCEQCGKISSLKNHWFCHFCSNIVCSYCAMKNHRNHKCEEIDIDRLMGECLSFLKPFAENANSFEYDFKIDEFCGDLCKLLKSKVRSEKDRAEFLASAEKFSNSNISTVDKPGAAKSTAVDFQRKINLVSTILSKLGSEYLVDAKLNLNKPVKFKNPVPNVEEIANLFFDISSCNENKTRVEQEKKIDAIQVVDVKVGQHPVCVTSKVGQQSDSVAVGTGQQVVVTDQLTVDSSQQLTSAIELDQHSSDATAELSQQRVDVVAEKTTSQQSDGSLQQAPSQQLANAVELDRRASQHLAIELNQQLENVSTNIATELLRRQRSVFFRSQKFSFENFWDLFDTRTILDQQVKQSTIAVASNDNDSGSVDDLLSLQPQSTGVVAANIKKLLRWKASQRLTLTNPSSLCAVPNVGVILLDHNYIHLFGPKLNRMAFRGMHANKLTNFQHKPSVVYYGSRNSIFVWKEVNADSGGVAANDDYMKILEFQIPSLKRVQALAYPPFADKDRRLLGVLKNGDLLCVSSSSMITLDPKGKLKWSPVWKRGDNECFENFEDMIVRNDDVASTTVYIMATSNVYVFTLAADNAAKYTVAKIPVGNSWPFVLIRNFVFGLNTEQSALVALDDDNAFASHVLMEPSKIFDGSIVEMSSAENAIYLLHCRSKVLFAGILQ